MLSESEKARLQRIFEWSNRGIGIPEPNRWRDNDQATNEEVQLIRKQGLGRGALKKQKRWLDILASEVVERETVLKVMRAEGQEQLSKDKLRHEIQERIKRMKEIQNNIARQERLDKQTQMAELVDNTKCCQATYNAQREKSRTSNDAKSFYSGGLSSQSKRLLEHNLNTSDKPPPANHRRYKHCHSPQTLPSVLPSKISSGVELSRQSKENHHHHHHHHHHKENYHKENHRQHVDKRQENDLKPSRHHHRTSCKSESGLKTKSASRA